MIDDSTDEAKIRALMEGWAAAVRERDIDGVIRDHATDVLMFDLPGPTQARGIAAYRDSWPQLFAWFGDASVFDLSELHITAGDAVAFATALIECRGVASNDDTVVLSVRLTVGLRKLDGRWTIVHEHHSIPNNDPDQSE